VATWKKVLTEGTKVPIIQQWSMRWYTDANNTLLGDARRRWFHFSTTYGPSYYQWSSYIAGADPRPTWFDSFNPGIVIPRACKLKRYTLHGNMNWTGISTGTLLLELKKNTNTLAHNNVATLIPLSTVGTRQSKEFTTGYYKKMGEDVDEVLREGDILIPFLARDDQLTNNNTMYFEGVFTLEYEREI